MNMSGAQVAEEFAVDGMPLAFVNFRNATIGKLNAQGRALTAEFLAGAKFRTLLVDERTRVLDTNEQPVSFTVVQKGPYKVFQFDN